MATLISSTIHSRTPKGVFANEPFINFKTAENIRAMRDALAKIGAQLGREYDLVIGGERVKTNGTSGKITSLNPAKPAQVVGVHQKAGAEHAATAMAAALKAFDSWS